MHSGIQTIVHSHVGVPADYAIQVLQTANGLSGMAATLLAIMTNNADITMAVRNAQLAHRDCLPPIPC